MYWQASIAIVPVAAWLQMGQVMMDCLSSHRTPFSNPAMVKGFAARTTRLRHFFRPCTFGRRARAASRRRSAPQGPRL